MEHPHQWLVDSDGERVKIDCEIVPLIQRLWDMGYETCNSCQDNFSYVWIEFVSAEQAVEFLNVILAHGDDDLAHRAANPYNVSPRHAAAQLAEYDAWPDSWLTAAHVHEYTDAREVYMTIGIRFPRQHLPKVMAALNA